MVNFLTSIESHHRNNVSRLGAVFCWENVWLSIRVMCNTTVYRTVMHLHTFGCTFLCSIHPYWLFVYRDMDRSYLTYHFLFTFVDCAVDCYDTVRAGYEINLLLTETLLSQPILLIIICLTQPILLIIICLARVLGWAVQREKNIYEWGPPSEYFKHTNKPGRVLIDTCPTTSRER